MKNTKNGRVIYMLINEELEFMEGCYISQLPTIVQNVVELEVKKGLMKNGLDESLIENELNIAMSSRLSDLNYLIPVKKILFKNKKQ